MGASSGRTEDAPMLCGAARYTGEHAGADTLHARFVRSTMAHARIVAVALAPARAVPGVVAVFAAADLDAVLPALPAALDAITNRDGSDAPAPPRPAVARDRVRFAGEAVALVIATTAAAAADGAEAVFVDYDPLPAMTALGEAGSGAIHPGGNLGFDWQGGDPAATSLAFAAAHHVTALRVAVPRILGLPLEPMSVVAGYDPATSRWTLVTPSQGAHAIRRELATGYLGTAPERLRVITPDVGGAFGIRIHALPEQAALLGAARVLGRTLAWQADRSESNLCEPHARDILVDAELALDREGHFLGLRAQASCALGAYVHPGARATPTASLLFGLQGAYRMPALSLSVRGWYTNTTPTGPFRGAGQPEGTFVLERLIDAAARQLGLSPAELRDRNVLRPGDFPYRSATGHHVDSGNPATLLHQAETWLAVQPRDTQGGRLRCGVGLALYMKVNGMGRQERAEVVASADSEMVVARIGSQSNGQGHATTFGAIVADRLGLSPERIRLVQGNTDQVAFGTGTGASSALATTGTGVSRSAADLLRRARTAAARLLDAEEASLAYACGSFTLPGTNRFATLQQLAAEAGGELVGRSEVPVSLTFTLGCHACVVSVDPETGVASVQRYAAFDDLGPLLQPAIAYGQLHGGIAQGLGQALLEAVSYDGSGQPITASLLDYCLPRASDLPNLECRIAQTPSPATDLGVRGAGEAGAIASMAAIVNAAEAALGGDCQLEAPLTPLAVWQAIDRSNAARCDRVPSPATLIRSHADA